VQKHIHKKYKINISQLRNLEIFYYNIKAVKFCANMFAFSIPPAATQNGELGLRLP
jgi:hypothetical protein